jgi:hypothetical protein
VPLYSQMKDFFNVCFLWQKPNWLLNFIPYKIYFQVIIVLPWSRAQ